MKIKKMLLKNQKSVLKPPTRPPPPPVYSNPWLIGFWGFFLASQTIPTPLLLGNKEY